MTTRTITRTITLTTPAPPAGTTFAAVQVEASRDGKEWRVVGAESTRDVEIRDGRVIRDTLLPRIAARCKLEPADTLIVCHWVCENSAYPNVTTGPHAPGEQPRRRR